MLAELKTTGKNEHRILLHKHSNEQNAMLLIISYIVSDSLMRTD